VFFFLTAAARRGRGSVNCVFNTQNERSKLIFLRHIKTLVEN
jgi:hypothetical protein